MINNSPLITIIIPVYNAEQYLRKCIDSIINQTYTNIEIILINDGSTDNSLSICKEYESNYDNIIVIDSPNGGAGHARNLGLKAATGEYIGFVDSDDYIEKDYISLLYKSMVSNHADISVCGVAKEIDAVSVIQILPAGKYSTKNYVYQTTDKNSYILWVVWGKLFNAKVLNGLEFKEGSIHEDEYFFNEIIKKELLFSIIDKPLYHYLDNEKGVTNSLVEKKVVSYYFDSINPILDRIHICKKMKLKKDILIIFVNALYGYAKRNRPIKPTVFFRYNFLIFSIKSLFIIPWFATLNKIKMRLFFLIFY